MPTVSASLAMLHLHWRSSEATRPDSTDKDRLWPPAKRIELTSVTRRYRASDLIARQVSLPVYFSSCAQASAPYVFCHWV